MAEKSTVRAAARPASRSTSGTAAAADQASINGWANTAADHTAARGGNRPHARPGVRVHEGFEKNPGV